jgi:hypothetical protein
MKTIVQESDNNQTLRKRAAADPGANFAGREPRPAIKCLHPFYTEKQVSAGRRHAFLFPPASRAACRPPPCALPHDAGQVCFSPNMTVRLAAPAEFT